MTQNDKSDPIDAVFERAERMAQRLAPIEPEKLVIISPPDHSWVKERFLSGERSAQGAWEQCDPAQAPPSRSADKERER